MEEGRILPLKRETKQLRGEEKRLAEKRIAPHFGQREWSAAWRKRVSYLHKQDLDHPRAHLPSMIFCFLQTTGTYRARRAHTQTHTHKHTHIFTSTQTNKYIYIVRLFRQMCINMNNE